MTIDPFDSSEIQRVHPAVERGGKGWMKMAFDILDKNIPPLCPDCN